MTRIAKSILERLEEALGNNDVTEIRRLVVEVSPERITTNDLKKFSVDRCINYITSAARISV